LFIVAPFAGLERTRKRLQESVTQSSRGAQHRSDFGPTFEIYQSRLLLGFFMIKAPTTTLCRKLDLSASTWLGKPEGPALSAL